MTEEFDPTAERHFWRAKGRHGKLKGPFIEPEVLARSIEDYFEWVEANPYLEEKVGWYEGEAIHTHVSKRRVPTIGSMRLFLGLSADQFRAVELNPQLRPICEAAREAIREEKFAGTAAGLYSSNLIIRDLGLADKSEISTPPGEAIRTITGEMTAEQAAEIYARTRDE